MKYSNLEDQRIRESEFKAWLLSLIISVFTILVLLIHSKAIGQETELKLRAPQIEKELDENIPTTIDVKKLPNFPDLLNIGTAKKSFATATTIPVNTRLRLAVDSYINAKESMLGDYFKAHILEDFYIPTDPPQLIIPKGAWIRGRISFLKKPSLFSMAGKIGLHLDQLTLPIGDVTPLDAELDVQQGIVNQQGLLDPMTNFGTKALEPTQMLLESQAGRIITVATLGSPVIGTLIGGSLIALFSEGDNISLYKGQELQIVLKTDIQLTVN